MKPIPIKLTNFSQINQDEGGENSSDTTISNRERETDRQKVRHGYH